MSRIGTALAGVTLTAALIAGSLVATPDADASEGVRSEPRMAGVLETEITAGMFDRAIAEARAVGAVKEDRVNADGTRSVVVEGSNGMRLELSATDPSGRLGTGSDGYGGLFVAFNAFDQNLIISGAMTAIAAGMCALGPAVCAVANVAALLAATAIGNSGGVRCGTKSLRVYPISHKKPRCA